MSTRGNVVFANKWYIEEKQMTEKDFKNVKPKSWFIKKSHNIYVHSDMYPSGALNNLQSFLQINGAKHRATDSSYLSAWFVGWKCLNMVKWCRRMGDSDFDPYKCTNPSLEDMESCQDFFGIGLLGMQLSDWASFSYLIIPVKDSFDIYIYDGAFDKFIAKVNSEEDLRKYEDEDWWC